MPGRYEGCENRQIAEWLDRYAVCSDQVGSVVEDGSWYGLVVFDYWASDEDPEIVRLLAPFAGAIIWEDSQGFFDYELFRRKRQLENAWKDTCKVFTEGEYA